MSDTTQAPADEIEILPPEPQPAGEPAQPQPETIQEPTGPQEGPRALTLAAQQVPVNAHGAAPANFGHQITLAQYMAKAQLMVPSHFHGNVGDCLAIIDIAQRAGLSPYMVAAKTYKDPKGKGIAFESQLYHAFLIGSGWLKDAALHVEYEGEGEGRTCKVWGTLRGETEPRYYTSPPLKDLLPAKNSDGVYKGSPLWGDKPDVQMFYDTTRDWGRMFCPIATLGMLAQYESIEHPIGAAGAVEITGSGQGLHERLQGADKSEGHKPGHVESELNNVASDAKTEIAPAGEAKPAKATKPDAKPKASTKKKTADKPEPERTTTLAKPSETVTKTEATQIADRAEATSKARKAAHPDQETDAPPAKVPTKPENAAEYQVYCIDWIDRGGDPEEALRRWDGEIGMRDSLSVPIKTRNALRARLETKHGV